VEAPGTAPGSDELIAVTVYRHSRTNPAVDNIGKIQVKKSFPCEAAAWPTGQLMQVGHTLERIEDVKGAPAGCRTAATAVFRCRVAAA